MEGNECFEKLNDNFSKSRPSQGETDNERALVLSGK